MTPGTRLGLYEIVSSLGAGGMGEVYRARDTRLGRDVAIKVLPAVLGGNPERLARFEREARVLASLSHPNIATIYNVEDAAGTPAIVMELVDGETLAQRISKENAPGTRSRSGSAGLPVTEALAVARQMADALDAAHKKGIVHRDLKPANIKITRDGVVKVLDFGLAKVSEVETEPETLSQVPTDIIAVTQPGFIVGTPAYMSPEQARGQAVDKRTDIWAFGCVLYEMLTGRSAFGGATVTDTLAAVVERQPDWAALPAAVSPAIRSLLERCLEKDTRRRQRDIGDVHRELTDAMAPSTATPALASRKRVGMRLAAVAAVIALVAIAAYALLMSQGNRSVATQPPGRFAIPLVEGERLANPGNSPLAVSPDGRYVAFETTRAGSSRLYLRAIGEPTPRLITDDSDGYPFFSPDSQWLAFFAADKLRRVSVRGGPPVVIADAFATRGGSWGDDGFIVFAPGGRRNLVRVSANGGTPEPLTQLDAARGETSHRGPWLLPCARVVLYRSEGGTYADGAIAAYSLDSKQVRIVVADGGYSPSYSPATGNLLYVQDDNLMSAPFDVERLELTAPAVQVVEAARTYGVSRTGTLIYAARQPIQTALEWVDPTDRSESLLAGPQVISHPRLRRDGRRVVMSLQRGTDRQIYTYDIERKALAKLTFDGSNLWPAVTPDGARVAYASNRPGNPWAMYWKAVDGSDSETALRNGQPGQIPRAISPDGVWLAYDAGTRETGSDIWLLPLRGGEPRLFLQTSTFDGEPAFSRDSQWLAYVSGESGRLEVYVKRMPGDARKWQISTDGGVEPLWHPNGRELLFRNGAGVYSVDITTGAGISASAPKLLFEGPYALSNTGSRNYDITADGRRFLMVRSTTPEVTTVNV